MSKKYKICPICHKAYNTPPAISRKDNSTAICPDCGIKEAIEDYKKFQNEISR